MKIAILTLPLHPNYGGILQAYALKTVLLQMGHEVTLLDQNSRVHNPFWRFPLSLTKRCFKKYILGDNDTTLFLERKWNKDIPIIQKYTDLFIKSHFPNQIPLSLYGIEIVNIFIHQNKKSSSLFSANNSTKDQKAHRI